MNKYRPLIWKFNWLLFQNGFEVKYLGRVVLYLIQALIMEPFYFINNFLLRKKFQKQSLKRDPIFILGYYRSGTTYFQSLLTLDKQFGYLNFFQALFPPLIGLGDRPMAKAANVIFKLLRIKHPAHNVELTSEFASEEDIALIALQNSTAANAGHLFPKNAWRYFSKYILMKGSSKERKAWMEDYDLFLKQLSLARGKKQLVLKTLPNMSRLPELLELYPHAKFIYLKRDPLYVFLSNRKLWHSIKDIWLQEISDTEIDTLILDLYGEMVEKYEEEKSLIPRDALIEFKFENFLENPVENIKAIYERFHLNFSDEYERNLVEYRKRRGQKGVGKHDNIELPQHISEKIERYRKFYDYSGSQTPTR